MIVMDKISNVSFTGIRNIAWAEFSRREPTVSKSLSMVLRDDFNGKDLTEFSNVIKKVTDTPKKFKNEISPEILNIECISGEGRFSDAVAVNGEILEVNDKNLPVFSYIAKMTRKIGSMSDKNMVVDNDYKNYVADESLIYGAKISDNLPSNLDRLNLINQFFEKDKVKVAAQQVNDFIQNIMNKYFE
mgnify:FL=1